MNSLSTLNSCLTGFYLVCIKILRYSLEQQLTPFLAQFHQKNEPIEKIVKTHLFYNGKESQILYVNPCVQSRMKNMFVKK